MGTFIKGVGAVACGVVFGWALIKGIDKAADYSAEKKREKAAAANVDEDGTINVEAEEVKTEEV